MPTISTFYGIAIRMSDNGHNPPHFHAIYGQSEALIRISDGAVLAGHLPANALRLVTQWLDAHRDDLDANWVPGREQKPFAPIAGLDDESCNPNGSRDRAEAAGRL